MYRYRKRRLKPGRRGDKLRADVVVVGAGLAGLTAALELLESGVCDVLVLEARARVGGRTLNRTLVGDVVCEMGGQWVGPSQTELLALADRLGIETFRTYDQGDGRYCFAGVRTRGPYPPIAKEHLAAFDQARAAIDRLASDIPLDRPWSAVQSALLDAQTVDDWFQRNLADQTIKDLFSGIVYGILGRAATQVSLLWFLFYVQSAGGIEALIQTSGGAQDSRFVGGSQKIALRLSALLEGHLLLRSPVRRISRYMGDRVEVSARHWRIEAKRVILAMMPADLQRISFVPTLPPQRKRLIAKWPAAPGLKANLGYQRPFWREQGLSGQALTDDYFTYDNSPPDGSYGVLVVSADPSRLPRSRRARRKAIVSTMEFLFGREAGKPVGYIEKNWHRERWNTGCVSPLPPGLLTSAGRSLRQAVGNLHWAGTETSEIWNGYMEGAVRSGLRAAREVLGRLR